MFNGNVTTILDVVSKPPDITRHVEQITFSAFDYAFFSLMLALSTIIGIYFGFFSKSQATAKEYLLGGKEMKIFPITMSLLSSHISGITLLALPADVYKFGASYCLSTISIIIIVFITIYVFLPIFYKLQTISTYQYLGLRFSNTIRQFASFLFALSQLLYLPLVIYIPALALSAATGINIHFITPVVCGVCIFYTTIGGLKAVVWTDTLQFTITLSSLIAVFALGLKSAGGFSAVWTKAADGQRLDIFDFDPDPTKRDSFWVVVIGITVNWISHYSTNQTCVQKFLALPTYSDAIKCIIYLGIGLVVVKSFSVMTGLIMFAKYADCDPFTTKEISKNDQLLPFYVMDVAGHIPGLPGLFIAGVFCAGLSTLSASLNCLSGTIYEDFIVKILKKRNSHKTEGFILKIIVVIIGVICTSLVFLFENLGGILPLSFAVGAIAHGPMLGLFILGALIPKANAKGALYGGIFGITFLFFITVISKYYEFLGLDHHEPKPLSTDGCNFLVNVTTFSKNTTIPLSSPEELPFFLFRITHYYYTLMGAAVTIISGVIISYLTYEENERPDKDLLSPVIHFLLSKDECVKKNINYNTVNTALDILTINDEKTEINKK